MVSEQDKEEILEEEMQSQQSSYKYLQEKVGIYGSSK